MSSNPRVSFVMPTYEAGDHLQECLESIRSQRFDDFELIIVDDGSTDETIQIVESIDDDRITLIQREEESGIPSARNHGIDASTGEYIACHDADDRSHPDRLATQVSYLDTHSEVAAVGSDARLIDVEGESFARRRVITDPSFDTLLQTNHFVHGSLLFRRSALADVGEYDKWFQVAEDYELLLRLAKNYPVRNITEPLYDLRIRTDSVYASELERITLYDYAAKTKATRPEDWGMIQRQLDSDGLHYLYDQLSPVEKGEYHLTVARELLRYGAMDDARTHSRNAIALNRSMLLGYLLYLLSMTSPSLARLVSRVYRKFLVNPRIMLSNLRG